MSAGTRSSRGKGLALAALGVVAIVVVAFVAWQGSNAPDKRAVGGYCADMPDAIGLYAGNPVTQMGFRVGRITGVAPKGKAVRVSFELDGDRKYPAEVRAVTRSKSLLADRSVELVDNYDSGPALEPGRCIGTDKSYTPKSISEVAGSAADFIDGLTSSGDSALKDTINGADKALAGTGPTASNMYTHAANAAQNPDRVTADIGASIMNMAPLNQAALDHWSQILSLLNNMPAVVGEGTELFAYVSKFDLGVGWLVRTLYDVQDKYGDIIWPIMNDGVANLIHLLAARAPDLQKLYAMVPAIAQYLHTQEGVSGGIRVPVAAPSMKVSTEQCAKLGITCQNSAGNAVSLNLFDAVVQKAGR